MWRLKESRTSAVGFPTVLALLLAGMLAIATLSPSQVGLYTPSTALELILLGAGCTAGLMFWIVFFFAAPVHVQARVEPLLPSSRYRRVITMMTFGIITGVLTELGGAVYLTAAAHRRSGLGGFVVFCLVEGVGTWALISMVRDLRQITRRSAELAARLEATPSSQGTILCNYVDTTTLLQVAAARGVALEPTLFETTKSTRDTRGVKAIFKGVLEGRSESEEQESERNVRELPFNAGSLTARVLMSLERDDLLIKSPFIHILSEPPEEAELKAALHKAGVDPEIAERVQRDLHHRAERRLSDAVMHLLREAGENASYMLVQGIWKMSVTADLVAMSLAWFNTSPAGDTMKFLPERVHIEVFLASRGDVVLTPRGLTRLHQGVEGNVRLSVFGTAEPFEDGQLRITPIVVFDRAGAGA
jgi:hypothetical protein